MNFLTALIELKKGNEIKRKNRSCGYILHNEIIHAKSYAPYTDIIDLCLDDILATDWEVVEVDRNYLRNAPKLPYINGNCKCLVQYKKRKPEKS